MGERLSVGLERRNSQASELGSRGEESPCVQLALLWKQTLGGQGYQGGGYKDPAGRWWQLGVEVVVTAVVTNGRVLVCLMDWVWEEGERNRG